MATIYRFIVESKGGKGGSGGTRKKSTAKSVTPLKLLTSGSGGGVNDNRSMRAFNWIGNKIIPGYEKAVRFSKASLGLVKIKPKKDGGYAFAGLSGTAIAVLVVLAMSIAMKLHQKEINRVEKENTANYKKLQNGQSAIHGQFEVSSNFWNGKITYKENR